MFVTLTIFLVSRYGGTVMDGAKSGEPWALGCCAALLLVVLYLVTKLFKMLLAPKIPTVTVELEEAEAKDVLEGYEKFSPHELNNEAFGREHHGKTVYYWDPSTMDKLGQAPAMGTEEVHAAVAKAKVASKEWAKSSFEQRRHVLKTILKYILENQETMARVSVRDSGKTTVDAMIGEVLTTCEKLQWTINNGEKYLKDEPRDVGALMMMKKVHVKFEPLGVIGAIVPWNYPFHNVFNPVISAIMSGNAITIKVSEYASWSIQYYQRVLHACLEAANAPKDLVQVVIGYAETGNALVTCPDVDKIIFVGSPGVGARVMEAASKNLTPVVLELGGKDPFVVCEDANVDSIVQTACRGVWQNMGQNCAGPERFFVYEGCYDEFCDKVVKVVKDMKQGPPLSDPCTDCGAICMGAGQMKHYQRLVDDAVSKGATVLNGGYLPEGDDPLAAGSFYPPTVLANVPESANIAQEEIFGPIMCIFKVQGNSDDEAIRMANNCDFALSSCAFSKSFKRAQNLANQLNAGMSAVNDLEGCTYMNQSLPFGGQKKSGFDRFAGPEGLRGMCSIRSVCEDRFPAIRNAIPPPLQYPSKGSGPQFAKGLILMFYGSSIFTKIQGVINILKAVMARSKRKD